MKQIIEKLPGIFTACYFIAIAVITLPCFFGYQVEAVISGSMAPAIPAGAVIFVKPVDFNDIAVDDVITYRLKDGETKVTHRVIEKNMGSRSFRTKGDANDIPDGGAVEYARVEGRVILALPLLGRAALLMTKIWGKGILAGLLLLLFVLGRLPAYFREKAGSKNQIPGCAVKERRSV